MLTIPARKTLKAFLELTDYSEDVFCFWDGTCRFFFEGDEANGVDLSVYEKEIDGILYLLEAEGYIRMSSGEIQLTQKAIHKEYVEWEEFKRFLCESIFVPIAVSAITTLVTLWLTELWQ